MNIQIDGSDIPVIEIEKLPSVISESLNEIGKADLELKKSIDKAAEAKQMAANAASKSAKWSWDGSKKKEAIETLQESAMAISEAQGSLVDALKQTFENQQKISESLKYLFGLGVMNMAANRTVVRELELKLKNASKEELSEMARQEINRVITQLKAQQDLSNRLEKHKKAIVFLSDSYNDLKSSFEKNLSDYDSRLFKFEKDYAEILSICNETIKKTVEDCDRNIQAKLLEFLETLEKHTQTTLLFLNESKEIYDKDIKELISVSNSLQQEVQSQLLKIGVELNKIDEKIEENLSKKLATINGQLLSLSREIDILKKKNFFDSLTYKVIVGIAAFGALIISISSLI